MELLFVVSTLVVVIVGLLIMTQLVTLGGFGQGIIRALLILGLLCVALWTMKVVVLPISICVLVWLKQAMLAAALRLLILLAITALLRSAFVKVTKHGVVRTNKKEKQ